MHGFDSKEKTAIGTNATFAAGEGVDLSRVDIAAIAAEAADLRAIESGRLLRQAWLTLGSLWRGPRRLTSPAQRQHAAGTVS